MLGLAGQNNVVQAAGQTIPLPSGSYTSLRLLGAAVNGARSGSFTIHYSDGTTSVVTQSFSDWAYPASYPNESIVARMPYRNRATNNGQDLRSMYLYGYTLPLVPGKIAQSLQLPVNGNIKILAMDLLGPRPQVSLSSSYNLVGLTTDDQTNLGNLDGGGYSYSVSALGGSSISWGASTFELGPAGQPNAVSAIGQTISLTNARATSLQLLASAVNGAQSGTFTVNYSDGTSTSFTQSVSDWALDSAEPGESIVATMTYRNHNQSGGNGRDSRTMYLYGYRFALDPGKPVVSVTLPNSPNIKILAMNVS